MYCKMCGNLLNDDEKICKKCNAVVGAKDEEDNSEEEIIYNPSFEDIDAEPEETAGNTIDTDALRQEDLVWNVHDFSKTQKKTEEVLFDWNSGKSSEPKEPTQNMSDTKVFDRATLIEANPEIRFEFESDAETAINSDSRAEDNSKFNTTETELFREIRLDGERINADQLDKIFAFSQKNEEYQKLLDREYERIKNRSVLHKEPELKVSDGTAPISPTEMPSQIQEMAAARESYFAAEDKPVPEPSNEIIDVKTVPDPVLAESVQEIPESVSVNPEIKLDSEPDNEPLEAEKDLDSDLHINKNEEPVTPNLPVENAEAEEKKVRAGKILLIIVAIILAVEIIVLGIRYFAPDSTAANYIKDAQTKAVSWIIHIKDKVTGGSEDQDKETLADNSKGQTDSGDMEEPEKNGQAGDKPSVKETGTTVPDSKPAMDKNSLILSQIGYNTNIEKVTANESLTYDPNKDYGLADINHSKTIENNIWINEDGKGPIYYDASIVGTIIDFDSKWIDYVNGNSNRVFELLKPESKAYQNAVSFSKVGKVKETFKLLEIGEIRQGSKGFYLWVHEEIQLQEKGSIQNKKYNWIYYLEPVNGQMKIVNYYKY